MARETLERASHYSGQLNSDLNSLSDWLNHLQMEIHKQEGEYSDNPNAAEEIRFYQVLARLSLLGLSGQAKNLILH